MEKFQKNNCEIVILHRVSKHPYLLREMQINIIIIMITAIIRMLSVSTFIDPPQCCTPGSVGDW